MNPPRVIRVLGYVTMAVCSTLVMVGLIGLVTQRHLAWVLVIVANSFMCAVGLDLTDSEDETHG